MGLLLSLCFICLALPAAFSQLTTVTIHLDPTSTLTEVVWALVTPLTTVFTPPCGAVIMAAQMETPECVAPGMSSVWRNGGFYSPGVCPSGYTTNCVRSEKRDGELIPVRPGETAAMCVPQGWTCYGGMPTNLAFYITSHGVYTAPAIEIRWRKRDLDSLHSVTLTTTSSPYHDVSTMTTPSTSVSMTLATASLVQPMPTNDTRPPESSTTPATDEDPGEHNFNNSELSGIIFGICVAIMGLMILIWCVMRYWEKNDCFSSGWSLRRNWNHRDSTRLYSPELVSTSPPMQQRPA